MEGGSVMMSDNHVRVKAFKNGARESEFWLHNPDRMPHAVRVVLSFASDPSVRSVRVALNYEDGTSAEWEAGL